MKEHLYIFFTIWYGVYNISTRELTYASGGHPPALLIGDTALDDSNAIPLRTPKNVIGALPDVAYQQSKHPVGEQATLYIFSDGVYEVEKSDGRCGNLKSLWILWTKPIRAANQSWIIFNNMSKILET